MRTDDSLAPWGMNDGVFYLAGPTASGKSAVALALAREIGGEIVNADAFQLYRGLPIITAQPSSDELATVPHHLYAVLEPSEACDAQRYHDLVQPVIADVAGRGHWPIVVGGSGLYLKSLTHGLATLPAVDLALRAELAAMTKQERISRLLQLDPDAEANVPMSNDRYVSRALEICILTGQPQSELRRTWQSIEPRFMGVLISRDREDLYARINARVPQMLEQGALDELRALDHWGRGAHEGVTAGRAVADLPLARAIGVRDFGALLQGECTRDEAIEAVQQASRRYAKRQATWFKRERVFQTVCLAPDSTATFAVERILELFPCLQSPPPPFVQSSSI